MWQALHYLIQRCMCYHLHLLPDRHDRMMEDDVLLFSKCSLEDVTVNDTGKPGLCIAKVHSDLSQRLLRVCKHVVQNRHMRMAQALNLYFTHGTPSEDYEQVAARHVLQDGE